MGAQRALVEAELVGREGPHRAPPALAQRVHAQPRDHQAVGRCQVKQEVLPEAREPQVERIRQVPSQGPLPPVRMCHFMGHVGALVVHLVGAHQLVFCGQQMDNGQCRVPDTTGACFSQLRETKLQKKPGSSAHSE